MLLKDLGNSVFFSCKSSEKQLTAEIYMRSPNKPDFEVDAGVLFGNLLSQPIQIVEKIYTPEHLKQLKGIVSKEVAEHLECHCYAKYQHQSSIPHEQKLENNVDDLCSVLVTIHDVIMFESYRLLRFVESFLYQSQNNDTMSEELLFFCMKNFDIETPHKYTLINRGTEFMPQFDDARLFTENYNLEVEELVKEQINMYNNNHKIMYTIADIPDLILAMLIEFLKSGKQLKRCAHCDKWFIPIKSDEKYCPRITGGISCKQAAAKKVRQETNRKKPHSKMYNNINTNLANRRDNAKTDEEYEVCEQRLLVFRAEAVEWKKQIKQGNKTENEYEQWLANYLKK